MEAPSSTKPQMRFTTACRLYTVVSYYIDAKHQYRRAKQRLNRYCRTERVSYNEIRAKVRKPNVWLEFRTKSKHFENVKTSLRAFCKTEHGKAITSGRQKEEKPFPLSPPVGNLQMVPLDDPERDKNSAHIVVLNNQITEFSAKILSLTRSYTVASSELKILQEEIDAKERTIRFVRDAHLSLMDALERFKVIGSPIIMKKSNAEIRELEKLYKRQVVAAKIVKDYKARPAREHLKSVLNEEKDSLFNLTVGDDPLSLAYEMGTQAELKRPPLVEGPPVAKQPVKKVVALPHFSELGNLPQPLPVPESDGLPVHRIRENIRDKSILNRYVSAIFWRILYARENWPDFKSQIREIYNSYYCGSGATPPPEVVQVLYYNDFGGPVLELIETMRTLSRKDEDILVKGVYGPRPELSVEQLASLRTKA